MTTHMEFMGSLLKYELTSYQEVMGIHPTKSIEAVSHLALRPKLFSKVLKARIPKYEASTDPPPGYEREGEPTIECPHCE